MDIFSAEFIKALNEECEKSVAAVEENGGTVTRKNILSALGLDDMDGVVVSLAFGMGLVPGFGMHKKAGIKRDGYAPLPKKASSKKKKRREETEVVEAEVQPEVAEAEATKSSNTYTSEETE